MLHKPNPLTSTFNNDEQLAKSEGVIKTTNPEHMQRGRLQRNNRAAARNQVVSGRNLQIQADNIRLVKKITKIALTKKRPPGLGGKPLRHAYASSGHRDGTQPRSLNISGRKAAQEKVSVRTSRAAFPLCLSLFAVVCKTLYRHHALRSNLTI
jgi:hypothetical protein